MDKYILRVRVYEKIQTQTKKHCGSDYVRDFARIHLLIERIYIRSYDYIYSPKTDSIPSKQTHSLKTNILMNETSTITHTHTNMQDPI